jgi:hypothetical protein
MIGCGRLAGGCRRGGGIAAERETSVCIKQEWSGIASRKLDRPNDCCTSLSLSPSPPKEVAILARLL